VLLIIGIVLFVTHNCQRKEVVEFESFEVSNPTPVSVHKDGQELPTYSTEAMK